MKKGVKIFICKDDSRNKDREDGHKRGKLF